MMTRKNDRIRWGSVAAAVLCLGLSGCCKDDVDCDGVLDASDNCPHKKNRVVETPEDGVTYTGGQPDDDADGIGDACDDDLLPWEITDGETPERCEECPGPCEGPNCPGSIAVGKHPYGAGFTTVEDVPRACVTSGEGVPEGAFDYATGEVTAGCWKECDLDGDGVLDWCRKLDLMVFSPTEDRTEPPPGTPASQCAYTDEESCVGDGFDWDGTCTSPSCDWALTSQQCAYAPGCFWSEDTCVPTVQTEEACRMAGCAWRSHGRVPALYAPEMDFRCDHTPAILDAPLADVARQRPLPIVLFSHGSIAGTALYTAFLAGLARYGFVVVALDHAGDTWHDNQDLWQGHIARYHLGLSQNPYCNVEACADLGLLGGAQPWQDYAGCSGFGEIADCFSASCTTWHGNTDQEDCEANGHVWEDEAATCFLGSGACAYEDSVDCGADPECEWFAGACRPQRAPSGCDAEDLDSQRFETPMRVRGERARDLSDVLTWLVGGMLYDEDGSASLPLPTTGGQGWNESGEWPWDVAGWSAGVLDPHRVGVMGQSRGGGTLVTLATKADYLDFDPDGDGQPDLGTDIDGDGTIDLPAVVWKAPAPDDRFTAALLLAPGSGTWNNPTLPGPPTTRILFPLKMPTMIQSAARDNKTHTSDWGPTGTSERKCPLDSTGSSTEVYGLTCSHEGMYAAAQFDAVELGDLVEDPSVPPRFLLVLDDVGHLQWIDDNSFEATIACDDEACTCPDPNNQLVFGVECTQPADAREKANTLSLEGARSFFGAFVAGNPGAWDLEAGDQFYEGEVIGSLEADWDRDAADPDCPGDPDDLRGDGVLDSLDDDPEHCAER